jgi:hypothetical protein
MEHIPAALKEAVVPVTEQTPLPAKLTVKPELAVALRVSGVPTVCAPGLAKVIVCVCKTLNV